MGLFKVTVTTVEHLLESKSYIHCQPSLGVALTSALSVEPYDGSA